MVCGGYWAKFSLRVEVISLSKAAIGTGSVPGGKGGGPWSVGLCAPEVTSAVVADEEGGASAVDGRSAGEAGGTAFSLLFSEFDMS